MSRSTARSIVLIASAGQLLDARNVWRIVQYLVGFRRLGFDAYYLESAPADANAMQAMQATETIDRVMRRFGFAHDWARIAEDEIANAQGPLSLRLKEVLDSCEVVIPLDGAAIPVSAKRFGGRLASLEVDQIQPLPVAVIPDYWLPFREANSDTFAAHATAATLLGKVPGTVNLAEIPLRSGQPIEWVDSKSPDQLGGNEIDDESLRLLQAGWRLRDAAPLLRDADWYRHYLVRSRGEVACVESADGGVAGLSLRSACYLAAGRPVIAPERSCVGLPKGRGLLSYSNVDEAVAAIEEITADYAAHCDAAAEIANEHFSFDKVLANWLTRHGIDLDSKSAPAKLVSPSPTASTGVTKQVKSTSAPPWALKVRLPKPITLNKRTGYALLASCLGDEDTGGGLFAFAGGQIEEIDRLSTAGLHCYEDAAGKAHLVRALRSTENSDGVAELVVYDRSGIARYDRIDGISDIHDVIWDGNGFVLASTGTNSVVWVGTDGQVKKTWHPPGERGDSWHLNCLLQADGHVLVAAFGRYNTHRGWHGKNDQPRGFVLDLETGQEVLSSLYCPHNPRRVGDDWFICNSSTFEVLQLSATDSTIRQRIRLSGWTRGLAISDDYLFVGESAKRRDPKVQYASIVVICRKTWQVIERISVPCREIYDLVLVPLELLSGAQTGFSTNPLRNYEQDQHALFRAAGVQVARLWATGEPLPAHACRIRVDAECPDSFTAGRELRINCTVENLGGAVLVSAPPFPVCISYKWLDAKTRQRVPGSEGFRTVLPRSLPPGKPMDMTVRIVNTPAAGDYILRITLVQESVAWFDEIHPENCRDFFVHVDAEKPAETSAEKSEVKSSTEQRSETVRAYV